MTTQTLAARIYEVYLAFDWGRYGPERARWVMDRPSYDRIRAAFVSEDQELARAQAHATVWSLVQDIICHACPAGPFASAQELREHMMAMADPANREPADDYLLGTPITVRDDGGEPHLELAG